MVTLIHVPSYAKDTFQASYKQINNNYGFNCINKRKSMIMCANCGGLGHVYRTCNHPTISYGFICYKIVEELGKRFPVYLMVQRKD